MTLNVSLRTVEGHFCSVLLSNIYWLTSLSTDSMLAFFSNIHPSSFVFQIPFSGMLLNVGLSLDSGPHLFLVPGWLLLFPVESVSAFHILLLLSVFFIRNTTALHFLFCFPRFFIYVNLSPTGAAIALNPGSLPVHWYHLL